MLKKLIVTHGLLIFRNQHLTPAQEIAASKVLGWHMESNEPDPGSAPNSSASRGEERRWETDDGRFKGEEEEKLQTGGGSNTWVANSSASLPSHPEIICQGNAALHNHFGLTMQLQMGLTMTNAGFHPDGAHNLQTNLPVVTSMYCLQAPERGGNTFFACGRLAFASATPELQRMARRLYVHYIFDESVQPVMQNGIRRVRFERHENTTKAVKVVRTVQPLVRQHPETGEESIYVSCQGVEYMEAGATETDPALYLNTTASFDLIETLLSGVTAEPIVYAHQWRVGDFAIWDNRLLLHAPGEAEMDGERLHHRVRLSGSAAANRDYEDDFLKYNATSLV
eukprot:gnl/MRDRNA2_/MRDRNA2_85729_c1_seq1.p1 gnl/MRDRNA2_/MRDRNA2_85729_c1~~gnl/MRDRNA2_/MRDRNA2_85729_c1_seq1.p1  ORF type:complete len:339 (+),score=50.50 gnl/MRDRNA2_/MRDRNA2_85729_c1_seq1:2-1018(+)